MHEPKNPENASAQVLIQLRYCLYRRFLSPVIIVVVKIARHRNYKRLKTVSYIEDFDQGSNRCKTK